MKKFLALTALCALLFAAADSHAQTNVQGEITTNTTWSSDVLLKGPVFVRSGATLTVEAGVTVYGEKASLAALIIDRGAKLVAIGTKDSPILFTSDQASPDRADWGGLIINGYSTLNVTGGEKEGEGDTGTFGCSGATCNEADNSGTLQYVRVEYGGIQFSPDNELNGIAFQAVGSGTTVDHVQVHMSKDDCVEFFGGTVSMKYAIMSACGDDSLDWTDGWRGSGQFLVVQQKGDEADRGIEADNLDKANDATPRSNPTLYNMTLVGDPSEGSTSTRGMTLRRGTAGNIRNSIVMGFATSSGCDIDDDATFAQADAGDLFVDNNIFYNNGQNFADDSATFLGTTMQNNKALDPKLGSAYSLTAPDFRPAADSPAVDGTVPVAAPPTGNTFIETVDFIGAVDPDNDWTRSAWTTYGTASWTPADCTDADEDGYAVEGGDCGEVDCDDSDATVNPGATEVCDDSIDNNCDGQVDEGCSTTTTTAPCPAQRVLGEDSPQLDSLRSFRDSTLAKTALGRKLITMYYAKSDLVNAVLERSPALKSFARNALNAMLPILEASEK